MKSKRCEVCGEPFLVKPYRDSTARFCSQKCGGVWHAQTRLNNGPKPYMVGNKLRLGLRPSNAFTSEQVSGSGNPRWQEGLTRACLHCRAEFKQKPWLARQNGAAKYCGRKCFEASGCFVGDKSSGYVGGITTYRGKGWLIARSAVVAEQAGKCAECAKNVGTSLPVHHKRPFREFATAQEANARANLIGLCQSCHMRAERRIPQPKAKAEQLTLLMEDA